MIIGTTIATSMALAIVVVRVVAHMRACVYRGYLAAGYHVLSLGMAVYRVWSRHITMWESDQ